MSIDKNRLMLQEEHVIYLNILHFVMTFSIIIFLLVIMVLFLGVAAKSPYAEHGFLTIFTIIIIILNLAGHILFHKAAGRLASSFSQNGSYTEEFYANITGILVSMIITRNITLVFPSVLACIAMFIAISGGGEFLYSWYSLNFIFPVVNLVVLVKNRPSEKYIREKIFALL